METSVTASIEDIRKKKFWMTKKKLSGSLKTPPIAGPEGPNADMGPQSQPRYGETVVNDGFQRIQKKSVNIQSVSCSRSQSKFIH